MTWISLLRRAWAAWKLHRRKFDFCRECSSPLFEGENPGSTLCTECKELADEQAAKANNDILTRQNLSGFATILAPGLAGLFANQQQQHREDQLRQMMNQQMNIDRSRLQAQQGKPIDLLQGLLGDLHGPWDKQ